MTPHQCTSLNCHELGCYYCAECSHALYFATGTDSRGKVWQWEFSPWFGPLWTRKDGEPMDRQPSIRNKHAWNLFEKWHWRLVMSDCRDMWE